LIILRSPTRDPALVISSGHPPSSRRDQILVYTIWVLNNLTLERTRATDTRYRRTTRLDCLTTLVVSKLNDSVVCLFFELFLKARQCLARQ
jgi:hypothetical protein